MKIGGSFLVNKIGEEEIFTCELFSDEQKEIAKLTEDFAVEQILPKKNAIEDLDENISRSIMKQAGELGLLAVDIPEQFEGLGMDKVTSAIINEKIAMGQTASFTVTFSAHSGIGTLPIVIFGNDEQKQKYLPKLGSGDWISAYALTEPGSGSDALAAKSTAKLDSSGNNFILNGTKQFITNGGWCDLAIVYAKVDGDKFTAFLVEMDSPGIERGAEENKMGLKGSSTTSLSFNDVKVPVSNVLGKIGKGHHIAFNILNIGRYKLGAAVLGSCKVCINEAVRYAQDRKQFDQPISNFDAIKSKFANMVVKTYELESILYRTVGDIDEAIRNINKNDQNYYDQIVNSLETYATEASICKVFGSEVIWINADDGLQIFGGYGFTEEYPLASLYRDTRVDRIYEGTNEINRQIIAGHFIKKAITGAKKNMIEVPLKGTTITHEIIGRCGGATVLLKPALNSSGPYPAITHPQSLLAIAEILEEKGAKTGALIGGGGGEILGQVIGGDTESTLLGAAIGTAVGGVSGHQIGAYMDRQEQELRTAMAASKAASIQRTQNVLMATFHSEFLFDFDSSTLKPGAYAEIARVANVLNRFPQTTIRVEGHTDSKASEAYNQVLSEKRSLAVKSALTQRGVDPTRIQTVGFGESQPISSNDAMNRRVVIVIIPT